jgi:hypothetical protein
MTLDDWHDGEDELVGQSLRRAVGSLILERSCLLEHALDHAGKYWAKCKADRDRSTVHST